jgi:hypothetical protein
MKLKVIFRVFGLKFDQTLFVQSPSMEAAITFIQRESPGCEIVSVTATNAAKAYAVSDNNGNRIG